MHHRNMFRPALVILVFLSLGCLIHSEANAQRMRMSPEERTKQLQE